MKRKTVIFWGTFLVLCFLLNKIGYTEYMDYAETMPVSVAKLEKITEKKYKQEQLEFQLLFEGVEIPKDWFEDTYYFPVSSKLSEFRRNLELKNPAQQIYWCEDSMWKQADDAVEKGHSFTFYVIDGECYDVGKIVFTGLPLICIEQYESEIENVNCHVSVIDNSPKTIHQYEILTSEGFYEVRGQTSKDFPKKSYNLNLYTAEGEKNDQKLLGMREDDDWKLNALYTDSSKVREAVAYKLWDEVAALTEEPYDKGTTMKYAEVLINSEYCGLYTLMEPTDYKQMSLNKESDVLYKALTFINEENRVSKDFEEREDYCGQVIKTADRDITKGLWQPMIEYLDAMKLDPYGSEPRNVQKMLEYIEKNMNLENLLNFELFLQAIYAHDNEYKNQYAAAVKETEGEGYCLWKIPWDLNYSFGDRYDGEAEDRTKFSGESTTKIMKRFFLTEILSQELDQTFQNALQKQWKMLRADLLSVEHVQQLAEMYYKEIYQSGALRRDALKWSEGNFDPSVEEIVNYYTERVLYLDAYYGIEPFTEPVP